MLLDLRDIWAAVSGRSPLRPRSLPPPPLRAVLTLYWILGPPAQRSAPLKYFRPARSAHMLWLFWPSVFVRAVARNFIRRDTHPFPFPPLAFPSHPLPSPFCPSISPFHSVPPWSTQEVFPSGSGQSPAGKRFSANLEHKIKHLTTTILTGFLIN